MTWNSDVAKVKAVAAPSSAAVEKQPVEAGQIAIAKDRATFSYVKANEPKGVEKPMRLVQEVVSNVDDIFHTGLREASRLGQWLQNSVIGRIVGWLPGKAQTAVTALPDTKLVGWLQRLTQMPFFGAFATTMSKVAPVVGLAMAPFDIKNMINLWKDPKALLPHKILTSIRTVTGTLMCLGGVAGLIVLPALGMPAAGAAVISVALKIGLVNLAASLPYWIKGIGGALGWVGSKLGGLAKKALSAL